MRGNCGIIDIVHCQGVLNTFLVMCMTLLWASVFSWDICEKTCRCTFETVDCSFLFWKRIHDGIPNDTRKLDLHYIALSNLSDYSFEHFPNLQYLDLSLSSVKNIAINAFVGPRQLLSLNLSGCDLSGKDFPKFKGLEDLQELKIGSCNIKNTSVLTFQTLTRLRRLDLSKNGFKYIDQEAFFGLKNLEVLDLSNNEFCLSELHPTVFQPLRSLINLLIFRDECSFTCMLLETNLSFPTLRSLSIGVQDLPFDPLRWGMTRLTFLSLRLFCNVNISGNSFMHVDSINTLSLLCDSPFIFKSVCATMMSDAFQNFLNLSTLFITVRDLEAIQHILSIALDNKCKPLCKIHISTSGGGMLTRSNLWPLNNSKIEELTLEFGHNVEIMRGELQFLPKSLDIITLIHTPLNFHSDITSGFDELPNLSLFKISTQSKRLDVIPRSHSSHVNRPPEDYAPAKPLKLDYSNNNYSFNFDQYNVYSLKIDSLDLSHNPIHHIPLAFGNIFSQVRIINLTDTKLSTIDDGTLQKITNITHLDLKNNNLAKMFRKENIFQNLINLKCRNLANNSITTVHKIILKDALNVEYLNLSWNEIVSINVDIHHTKLKTLDLSYNNIQFISNSYARQIEQLCKQSHLEINLAGNPLRCTCDYLQFFQLTVSCKLTLQDAHLTYCKFQNGTSATLDDVNRILDDLERECKSKIPILVGSVVASIFLVLIFVGALAYRYRWKLRYLYYASKLKWFKRTYDGAAYQRIFDYDAFVSYTDTNNVFVRNEMIPKLEVENGIRLCVHERDFIAGESVACNISRAIHSSKRTIIVLTEDFLKSDWCMYELNMARLEDLYSDRNVILIIFIHDFDLGKLPLDVLDLVRLKTYLKYPEDLTDRETFWRKCVEFIQ